MKNNFTLIGYILFGCAVCTGYSQAFRGGYRLDSVLRMPHVLLGRAGWGSGVHHK